MTEKPENQSNGWTDEERAGLRTLMRMGVYLLIGIIVAGTIAAVLSLMMGTL